MAKQKPRPRPRAVPIARGPNDRRKLVGDPAPTRDAATESGRKAGARRSSPRADDGLDEGPQPSDDDKAIVEHGLRRFQLIVAAEQAQRARELEDLLFDRALPQDQWPTDIWNERQGNSSESGTLTTSRPCLVIPKLDQPVMQVINEIVAANLGIRVTAKAGAGKKDAEVRQGLIRCIEQDSLASTAYDWGANRMVKCGRGFWRVNKKFANDGDFELDLTVDRILNQGSVYVDPFATEATWADMEYAFITRDIPEEEYVRLYGGRESLHKSIVNDPGVLQAVLDAAPFWVVGTTGARTYRVAEYFYAVYTPRTRYAVQGPAGPLLAWADEMTAEEVRLAEAGVKTKAVKKREVQQRSIRWVVMNAYEVLDQEEWEGRYIPVIPCTGKEYMVGGERVWKGIVSNAKDAQRSYNYMRSAQVEAVGLAPRAPWVLAEGQDEGYEAMWQEANVRNFPYLVYKATTVDGQLAPPPQRNVAEPAIQAVTLAVREADADIKATTGRYDPSLGQVRGDQSGSAIEKLQRQGENTTSNYVNSTALAVTYTGMVINDMLEHVYNTPGRVARTLGDEDTERPVLFSQWYVEKDGDAVPAAEGEPGAQFFDLSKGQFLVRVAAGKTFATQQEETSRVLETVFQAAPQLVPLGADLWIESLGSPVSRKMAERIRKANPQLQDDDDPQMRDLPAAAKSMISQLQQKSQALEQQNSQLIEALQKETEALKGKKAEAQAAEQGKVAQKNLELKATLHLELIKQSGELQRTILDAKVKLAIEMAKLQGASERDQAQRQMDRLDQQLELAHERGMQALELQAAEKESGRARGHEMGVALSTKMLEQVAPEGDETGAAPSAAPMAALPSPVEPFAAPLPPEPGASQGL